MDPRALPNLVLRLTDVLSQIEHFFTHYKDLEADKWVRVGKWGDAADAARILTEAIERAKDGARAA